MSLARAFTKRMKRNDDALSPIGLSSGNTVKYAPGTINRNQISLPTELISTTNVHALNAPDIRKVSGSSTSSSSSTHSGNDSDFSTIDRSFLTDTSISSPVTPMTPPMEMEKDFFDTKAVEATPTPALPQRSPTHSKRAHVELSRKRSIQRMSPPPSVISQATTVVRTSSDIFGSSTPIESSHPFGPELVQVSKIAEDFGISSRSAVVLDEEEELMLAKGLHKFDAQDYLDEIAGLTGGVFEDKLGFAANPWL